MTPAYSIIDHLPRNLVVGSMCHCDDDEPDECEDHWEFFVDPVMAYDGEHVRSGHTLSPSEMRAIATLVNQATVEVRR